MPDGHAGATAPDAAGAPGGYGDDAAPLRCLAVGLRWFTSGAGGLDRFYSGLLADLPEADVRAHGIVVGPDDARELSGGRAEAIGCANASLPRRLFAARRAIGNALRDARAAGAPFDLVASHFAMLTAPAIDRIGPLPLVVHFHGPWADESAVEGQAGVAVAAKRALERLALRRATRVITLSDSFAELAHARLGVPRARLRVVPGSADTGRFAPTVDRATARARLGLPPDRRLLVAVRRLQARMGLEDLIDAMRALVARHPDVLLAIGGRGPLAPALAARIAAAGLADHVRLLGFVPDADLPLVYRAAELNLVPTVALEGFGLTTVEALAAGTPSMVTPVGGLPEVMRTIAPELVLPTTGASAIADGLDGFLAGRLAVPDTAHCVREAGRFAGPAIAQLTAAVYREAVRDAALARSAGRRTR